MYLTEEEKIASDRRYVEKMDLSLYKRFGYPEMKELGVTTPEMVGTYILETEGEVYEIGKERFSRIMKGDRQDIQLSGNAVILFTELPNGKAHSFRCGMRVRSDTEYPKA